MTAPVAGQWARLCTQRAAQPRPLAGSWQPGNARMAGDSAVNGADRASAVMI